LTHTRRAHGCDHIYFGLHQLYLNYARASGCLGSSRGPSSTTSPTPRVWVPRHVVRLLARLVVDYFAFVVRLSLLGSSCGST
jgi:hypothetical protein